MYTLEDVFAILTYEEIYFIFSDIIENDCYVEECYTSDEYEQFYQFLIDANLVWTTSDDRLLLTPLGEKVLQTVSKYVELNPKGYKVIEEL